MNRHARRAMASNLVRSAKHSPEVKEALAALKAEHGRKVAERVERAMATRHATGVSADARDVIKRALAKS